MTKRDYERYLKSKHWKNLRKEKFRKAKLLCAMRCAICGSTSQLVCHHLVYKNLYDVELGDLRILCEVCHNTAHNLINDHILDLIGYNNPQEIYTVTKAAVRKALNLIGTNLRSEDRDKNPNPTLPGLDDKTLFALIAEESPHSVCDYIT